MDAACAASAIVGLVFNCATAIKTCNDLRGKYRNADRTLRSISTEVSTLQSSLLQLQHLMIRDPAALSSRWDVESMLPQTFELAIEGFQGMLAALNHDLVRITGKKRASLGATFKQIWKVKLLWDEAAMQDLLVQIRGHQQSLQFLLTILQLSSISEIKSGIRKNQSLLRRVARSTKELERRHRESSNTPTLPGDQYLKPRDRLDNGTSDSETDNEDEGGEVREPPAKRRSLSPEEEEGKVPRSPARTRSGRVFRPTIGASKIENTTDIQSKSPESSFSPPRDNPLVFGDLSSLFSSSGQPHPISKQIKPRRQQTRGVRGLSRSMPSLTPEWISPSSQTNLSSIFHDQEESGSSNKAGPSNDPIFSPGPRPPAIYAQASSGGGQGIQILTPPDTPNDEMIGDNFPVKPNKGKGTTISSREEFEVASSSTNKLKGVIQQQSHLKVTDLNEDSKLGSISCQPPTSSPNAQSSGTYGSSLASRNKQNKPLDISKYRQNFGDSKSQPDTISESHTAATSSKKSSTVAKATEADARKYRIPPGYSLKNWDPSEEPILLLGSVFDANSLGKWIYDWSVYHHGPGTPISNLSGELWLLLIQCFGKVKRSEEAMPKIRREMDREMIEDFIESGERLTGKLKKLLRVCEVSMVKGGRKKSKEEEKVELVKNAGCEFVDALFRKEGQLAATEKLMSSFRLWNLRFDANCEDILKRPSGS